MALAEVDLQLFAIYFLQHLDDESGYSRYYVKELASRYRTFRNRVRQDNKYSFSDMFNYLKQKKFVYMNRGQVIKKPLFISAVPGNHLVFTINPGSEMCEEFYVCQICDRGFSTQHGLGTHFVSDSHIQLINLLCQNIGRNFVCPKLECGFRGRTKDEFLSHLHNGKSIKVTRDLNSNEVRLRRDRQEIYYCETCCVRCNTENSFQQHKDGKKHAMNLFRETYRNNRDRLIQNKGNICVRFQHDEEGDPGALLTVSGGQNVNKTVTLEIVNNGSLVVFESCVHFLFYGPRSVRLSDTANVCGGAKHRIKAGGRYEVTVTICPTSHGTIKIPILLGFKGRGGQLNILREIVFRCIADPEVFADIQPVAPYVKPKKKEATALKVVRSEVKPAANSKMLLERVIKLGEYEIPYNIADAISYVGAADNEENAKERWIEMISYLQLGNLQPETYATYFDNLLYIEEHQMHIDINQYSMENVPMRKEAKSNLLVVDVPGLAENRPSVLKGDHIYAVRDVDEGQKYEGHVHTVQNTSLKLEFHERFTKSFIDKMQFQIEFTINRFSLKLEHRAVSEQMARQIRQLLFPSPGVDTRLSPPVVPLRFFNTHVENNYEQNTAVRRILAGTSGSAPYLIYGPPGTGKTFTLVEAIKQVYTTVKNCRILACAPQNAAADLITKRLSDHVDEKDMLRLNAPSRSYEDVEPEVRKRSNYSSSGGSSGAGASGLARRHVLGGSAGVAGMEVEFPKREVLKQRKILVSTLVTSGRLVSADMTKHFTHIFIDEAGHATEPETVIPLSGLIKSAHDNVQVVLAGDPKQLGPVVRSPLATALGKSLLERLMAFDLYGRDPRTGYFNANYVTKLVRSFRSHPDILEVPNSCFYDNELQACADKLQRERFCNWEGLPTKGFPMIFHGVNGTEEREANSPSWFNKYEVMQVIEYVKLLMECKSPRVKPEHIGIISPYHQQVNKINRGLQALERQTRERTRNYARIKVGSVEKFQGDEREVIIISTVRSQDFYLTHDKDFNLGFVGNPKRFNVAITRAKALLIVIGNPSILRRDRNWLQLINHIEEGGGYVGCPPPDEVDGDDIEDLTLLTESLTIKEALNQGASDHLQQGDQEWTRKE